MARILIIDDDRSLLELLSGYLERQAYDVTTAASGQIGLTIFADQGADLVILVGRCWHGSGSSRMSPSSC